MMHISTSHKTAILVKPGSYFTEKMSSGFPSDVLRLLCLSAAFYLVELSPTTTRCCCCSFSLQAAYMLLSGTSVNHSVEAEQWEDIRGKTRGHFVHKYDPVLLKLLFYAMYERASLSFVSLSLSQSKLHSVALKVSSIRAR